MIAHLYPSELGRDLITLTCRRVSSTHLRATCPVVPTGLRECSCEQTTQVSQVSCTSAKVTDNPHVFTVDHLVFCPACMRCQCSHWATSLPDGLVGTISSHCTLASVSASSFPGEERGACPVAGFTVMCFLWPNSQRPCHEACPIMACAQPPTYLHAR